MNAPLNATRALLSAPASRRAFLKVTALAGVGFMVGCGPAAEKPIDAPHTDVSPENLVSTPLNAFVRIANDNTVTAIIKHLDKGQGVTTGLTTIVAEEIGADWSQMRWEFAPADATRYNNLFFGPVQGTGGSTAIANSYMQLRMAAAAAREMLISAAAALWAVTDDAFTVEKGVVRHASGKSATFGELAETAAAMAPPAEPKLKDPATFTLIGAEGVHRVDHMTKATGKAQYTIDTVVPGMLNAVVAHPPQFGGRVKSFDAGAAKAVPGVVDVVQIPRGIAVLANGHWEALKGREALQIEWDLSAAENRSTAEIFEDYKALAAKTGAVARNDGDAEAALAKGAKTLEAVYEFPYLSHASMEPLNAIVEIKGDAVEIWTASQIPTIDQQVVAAIAGTTPEKVKINTLFAGGSFGRRAVPDSDYVAEAAMIAKAIGGRAPVKLQWTREDDMRAGRYRPMSYHVIKGSVDAAGNISGWHHRVVIQSIIEGTPFAAFGFEGDVDNNALEGSVGLPYAIPNLKVDMHIARAGVPVLWWRSVGHTHNAYVTETFFDELARLGGKDPFALRQTLLANHPRHLGVLNLADEMAGPAPTGPGQGRGVAVHESFASFVAQIVDVTVTDGTLKVDRVVCAVDCGLAINPDIIRAQMEGGIGYGLSSILREQVTLTGGVVNEDNFPMYPVLRIDEMPKVEVHIVKSAEAPTGVGEPGTPVIGPALANAVFAATGKLIRRLPFGDQLGA